MKKLVYNPGSTPLVYDHYGRMVDPLDWGYVEVHGTRVNRYIEDGQLMEVQVPTKLPENVHPRVLPLLQEAINDRSADAPEPFAEADRNLPEEELRNTEAQPAKTSARKSNKEA